MKDIVKKITEQIEYLEGDAYFYDMQIKFITYLKETSPEVESEMENNSFDFIINEDKRKKENILREIAILNVKLQNLTDQKAC